MAFGDLTTLDAVKPWLFATSPAPSGDDALLGRLITAASQFIQSWLSRQIAAQAWVEQRDGGGGRRLAFLNYPVTAVTGVSIDGVAIAPAVDTVSAGYVWSPTVLALQGGLTFRRGLQNIRLSYVAGYATPPPDLEQACIELVALRYRERDRIGQRSKSLAGESVSFSQLDLPPDVTTLLQNWRRVIS